MYDNACARLLRLHANSTRECRGILGRTQEGSSNHRAFEIKAEPFRNNWDLRCCSSAKEIIVWSIATTEATGQTFLGILARLELKGWRHGLGFEHYRQHQVSLTSDDAKATHIGCNSIAPRVVGKRGRPPRQPADESFQFMIRTIFRTPTECERASEADWVIAESGSESADANVERRNSRKHTRESGKRD